MEKKKEATNKDNNGYHSTRRNFINLLILQILFGIGLFCLPIQNVRKWIYPTLLMYSWISFLNVPVKFSVPMAHFHNYTLLGATTIFVGWGICYIFGTIDFIVSFKKLEK